MNISPVNNFVAPIFGHHHKNENKDVIPYSKKDKAVIAGTSALGVVTSLSVLAKRDGYSLNPAKMFKNYSKSYFARTKFTALPVVAMGVGTCLGGLIGGYTVDKNTENRSSKRREAIMQMGNISIPICTVDKFAEYGEKIGAKKGPKSAKAAKGAASIIGLFLGVYTANFLMNKLGNLLFRSKNERGVKATDFSAHVDDMVLAATYVDDTNKYVHKIGRIVPLALVVPGYEVGTKKVV